VPIPNLVTGEGVDEVASAKSQQKVGALFAAGGLALTVLVFWVGQATATPAGGARPATIPLWVALQIDHPRPATYPLPTALTAPSTVAGTVVSPDQAGAVLLAIWNLRSEAFTSNNRAFMAEFETGPALEADEVTCGCNSRAVRGPIYGESVFVPKQTAFPATFFAEVNTTLFDGPYVQYLVITRESMATPWMVVADPGESGNRPLDQPKIGPGGYDVSPAPGPASANLPSELATYWATWTEAGHAPAQNLFAPGEWTTQAGASFAEHPSGSEDSHNGLVGYFAFKGGTSNEVWGFGTTTGAITCGVVRWQTIWTDPGGGPRQDPARHNWGPSVAPGIYQYMAETQITQPCFIQDPGTRIVVTSGLGDPDTMQGIGTASTTGIGIAIAILFLLWFVVIIGSLVMMIVALVDIVRRPDWQWKLAGQEKTVWLLLVILVNFLAIPSLIYWFNIRKKLKAVEDAAAKGHYGRGHMTYSGWEPTPLPSAYVGIPPPGWYPDSSDQSRYRWWDGTKWTEHTAPGGPPNP